MKWEYRDVAKIRLRRQHSVSGGVSLRCAWTCRFICDTNIRLDGVCSKKTGKGKADVGIARYVSPCGRGSKGLGYEANYSSTCWTIESRCLSVPVMSAGV